MNKKPVVHTAETLFDIPDVLPGQFLVVPKDNKMFEEETLPVSNFENIPEWYANLDREVHGFRNCQGAHDFLRNGITFRLPAAVEFRPSRDGKTWEARYAVNGPRSVFGVEGFTHESVGDSPPVVGLRGLPESNYVKLLNPWRVKTAPGWSSVYIPPFWDRQSRDYELVPGVVNTDYYHSAHWVIAIFTDQPFTIPYGTPIAHMITFPRVKNDRVIYGDEKMAHLLDDRGFGGAWSPMKRGNAYRVEQRKAGLAACPFPHGQNEPKKRFWSRIFGRRRP